MPRIARPNLCCWVLLLALLTAACVPARDVPPQLSATAAPPYVISADGLSTARYQVRPPAGWRVIAGPAQDPYTFQFVNPADSALLVVSDRAMADDALPRPAGLPVPSEQALVLRGPADAPAFVYAVGAPSEAEALGVILARVAESLRPPADPTP
jgi:hypothetical protein